MTPVYLDDYLIVLDKPSGLLAVPGRGPDKQDCLSARAQAQWPDAMVVHRLDMDTSGLLLMARGAEMQRVLSIAFARRRVHKRYVAVVAGRMPAPGEEWGIIDLPLMVDWPNRPRSKVDLEQGKASLTRWRVSGYGDDCTYVELEPITGRSHQLRVHLAALGHPILGDPLYAPPDIEGRSGRLLLHAIRIGFDHPATGEAVLFESAAPFWPGCPAVGGHAGDRATDRAGGS